MELLYTRAVLVHVLRGKSWRKQASSDDALFVHFRVNSPHRVSFEYTCASTPHPIFRLYPRGYRRGGGSRGVGQGEGGLNVDLIGRSSRLGEARRRERECCFWANGFPHALATRTWRLYRHSYPLSILLSCRRQPRQPLSPVCTTAQEKSGTKNKKHTEITESLRASMFVYRLPCRCFIHRAPM